MWSIMKGRIYMKKVLSVLVVLCMMMAFVPTVGAMQPYAKSLNGEWDFKFYPNSSDVPEDVTGIVFEDKIQVPGAMELQGYGYPSYYYEEITDWGMSEDDGVRSAGVYKIELPSGLGETCMLRFDNASDKLTVYVNGKKVAESKNGAMGTDVLSVPVNYQKATLICVVERDKSGINKADDFALSGLLGDVWVANSLSYTKAKPVVEVNEKSVTVDGKAVVLKGVRYTPTHPDAGNNLSNEQIDKDLALIKEYGFNAVWTSGAPEYFYYKAEEMELYVVDEANVNLSYADRDMEAAKKRIEEMVKKHSYGSVIMWSVGHGEGNSGVLIDYIKTLDNRPVAQEVSFAPDFKVFGNSGGMEDWVKALGDGNVGGFVDEFADKELYYTQNAYVFDVKDVVTGETVTIDGEIENYNGAQYLGNAEFVRNIDKMDKYTIVTEVGTVDGDRVIFESGSVKFEIRGGRARFNVGNARARADVQGGKIAAVYRDGEIQLFVNNGFAENAVADAKIEGSYKVGGGDTAIEYVEIYNDALSLDELIDGADKGKLVSRVAFDDIDIKEDKSYKFLAYGGDFGDNPNSYYKGLTGIFSSVREPHPEAEAFKQLLIDKPVIGMATVSTVPADELEKVSPVISDTGAVWSTDKFKVTVDFQGRITSYVYEGKELLTDAMYPTVLRDNTISETEMGKWQEEGWKASTHKLEDDVFFADIKSTVTEGDMSLAYYMTKDGSMHVSMQVLTASGAQKPTFIGFRGAGEYDKASWLGKAVSSYPDRVSRGATTLYTKSIDEMTDNYTIMQENGNKDALKATLESDDGKLLSFGASLKNLNFQVHNYSPRATEEEERYSDVEKENKAYFRVGGYIAGLSEDSKYKLNNNIYGYDFSIIPFDCDYIYSYDEVAGLFMPVDEDFSAFTHMVKDYVVRVYNPLNIPLEVGGLGSEFAGKGTDKVEIGDYTVYFAPDDVYMSDLPVLETSGEIALDADFSGAKISIRGNDYWSEPTQYDKGVVIKNGRVTYDVSGMDNHVFNAIIGKNDFDWRRMGGNFDRNMFNASSSVTIALDGVVVEEINDVSMRSPSKAVSIDVSDAKEMTITVKGSGKAAQYEDAVFAGASFVPNGPVVIGFEKKDGVAKITVLNTDKEQVDVVLTAFENGVVTTEATSINKGLYKTIKVKASDDAFVKAYVTGLGEIICE